MGRGSGTGSPSWFRCYIERRGIGSEHRIELTGRQRPAHFKRAPGNRSTFIDREYRCSCGHVGWSNHIDLARLAGDDEYKGTRFEGRLKR